MPERTLIVVGGGAAGFFCAVNAARLDPDLLVILLEKSNKLLAKVKISGGGRCNVTHACFDITEMSRHYPRGQHFTRKAFHQFFTTDTIQWFNERGIELKTEKDGRVFPVTDSSQTIIDCLLKEANKYRVDIRMLSEVKSVVREKEKFIIELAGARTLTADLVCIASGGYPKTSLFEWLLKTGHSVEEPLPSLFTFNIPASPLTKLMGVSVTNATVKIVRTKLEETGPVLITHWGLSGPAILRLSAWGAKELAAMNYSFTIIVNWLPEYNEQSLAEKFKSLRITAAAHKIAGRNYLGLPQRLWEYFLQEAGINTEIRWADLPAKQSNKLIKILCASEYGIKGKTTFKEEFVTAGGIRLTEVDPLTMQSKLQPGLFFAGEVLDVDGITGGFNFQHAWTSSWIAANSLAKMK